MGLMVVRQALCVLTHTPSPFLLSYVFLISSCAFCSELALDHDTSSSTSSVAGIIDVNDHSWLVY
jgi:hypothetical protein